MDENARHRSAQAGGKQGAKGAKGPTAKELKKARAALATAEEEERRLQQSGRSRERRIAALGQLLNRPGRSGLSEEQRAVLLQRLRAGLAGTNKPMDRPVEDSMADNSTAR